MAIRTRPWLTLLALGAFGCDNSDVVANRFGTPGAGDSSGDSSSAGSQAETSGGSDAIGGASVSTSGSANVAGSDLGGAAGSSGDSDTAGAGGSDNPSSSPNCDDGNPCTADSFAAGDCRHDAVPDGQRCEDGDFCTLGDRCSSGECSAGERQTGAAQALGTLDTYGTSFLVNAGIVGMVVTPGDDRFVFVDQPEFVPLVTETRVVDGTLQTLDMLAFPNLDSTDPPIAAAWDDFIAVAGNTSSTEIGGDPRPLQIVSVSAAGKLTARGTAPMGGDAITSMVGRGQRLLVCTNFSFFTPLSGTLHWLDLTDPDLPVEVASGPLGVGCGSLALSEDTERVYVNTPNGVRFTDLSAWSGSGPLTFAADPIVPTDAGLALRGNQLLARTGTTIHLLDETTHAELSSFSVPGAHAAGFTDAGIFVQGDRPSGTGSQYFIALYTQTGELIQERTLTSYAYLRDIASAKPAVAAQYVTDTVDDQLFRVTSTGFQPVATPRVGGLSKLFNSGGKVQARGLYNAQQIDVTDPMKPTIVAGGPHGNPVFGIKLDESLSPPSLLPDLNPTTFHPSYDFIQVTAFAHASSTNVERITVDAAEHPVSGGSIQLPGGDSLLLSAGDFVYRVVTISGSAHIQRWLLRDLRAGITTPAMDLDVASPGVSFDVDADARIAVAVTKSAVQWLDLSTDPPTVTVTPVTSPPSGNVKVRGHRMVGSLSDNIGFMEFGSSVVETVPAAAHHLWDIEDILAFDGNVAYVSGSIPGGDGVRGGAALELIRRGVPTEQALVGEIRMPSAPTSLVAMDHSLVVGSASQLVTLSPACE